MITKNTKNINFLLANSYAYEHIVKEIKQIDKRDKEAILNKVVSAASFAISFHPGRFADGAIENVAFGIGRRLENLSDKENSEKENYGIGIHRRRILHVASQIQGVGGHTRMICHWIHNDQGSCHSLVVLGYGDSQIRKWLLNTIQNNGGDFLIFSKEESLCQRAKMLRELSKGYDLVVLHIDGYDVIPIVAFAVHKCPPVVFVNNSDHTFLLGSSIADMVINLRTIASKHMAERVFFDSNLVLPIPLLDPKNKISRENARQLLRIPENQIVLISIGRADKYKPFGSYDFVYTAGKILEQHNNAHIYVVGESYEGIAPFLRSEVHNRLHFEGIKEDPSLYRIAADIYLESFPFGSQTALLEAGLNALPVVPAYDPLFPLMVANDDALWDILSNPADEDEYIKTVDQLIKNPEHRIMQGMILRKRLLIDHIGDGWLNKLTAIYRITDSLIHQPKQIPIIPCKVMPEDIRLSMWHVIGKRDSSGSDSEWLWHKAFLSKSVRDYPNLALYACCAMIFNPEGSWRIFKALKNIYQKRIRK